MNETKLIAALEGATGPDRRIDCQLADTFCVWPEGWTRNEWKTEAAEFVNYVNPDKWGEWMEAPAFTASIDAALTLVPEGWEMLRVLWLTACVEVSMRSGFATASARAATPALAICIAAHRARGEL